MTYTFTPEEETNRKYWNEVAKVHYKSYNLDPLRKRKSSLIDKVQKEAFYPVKDKSILHLQCHIGTDTLSLALDGAKVTGLDFSEESIDHAIRLSEEMDIPARFIKSSVFDASTVLDEKFDIVYTGKGAVMWMPDIKRWADPYFREGKPLFFEEEWPDYSDKTYIAQNPTYEWNWTLSDIVNALINAGLQIEKLEEMEHIFYKALPSFQRIEGEEAWYFWPGKEKKFPLSFAIKAKKVK